jgi:hypothetical protein
VGLQVPMVGRWELTERGYGCTLASACISLPAVPLHETNWTPKIPIFSDWWSKSSEFKSATHVFQDFHLKNQTTQQCWIPST